MSFLNSGEQTCPDFLKYILKMVLELLAHIGMRKNERHPQPWIFFFTRSVLPCSRWGCRQTLHWCFPSLAGLQFSSVAQSCPTFSDPMDCSTPGIPVHHQLPELAQTHVHRVGDAIQPSHPLSSPSPAFNLSRRQGLFKGVSSSDSKALEFELQHQSFQLILGSYHCPASHKMLCI